MTTEVFATLAQNATDSASRKVAHRASRAGQVLKMTGQSTLDDARGQVERLRLEYTRRSDRYIGQVEQRKELLARSANLELDAALNGTNNNEAIAQAKTDLDQLELAITSWSSVEPELLERIRQAEAHVAALTKESQLAEIDNLLDAEKGKALALFDVYKTFLDRVVELQRIVAHKQQLQAATGSGYNGLGMHSLGLPGTGPNAMSERELSNRLSAAKQQLFVN